jgi:threonine dehydratase
MITACDVVAARRRISPHLPATPLRRSEWLSQHVGGAVHLKLESVHPTNSFKIRGAFNTVLRINDDARRRGNARPHIVTASAGNHGRAMALVSERLGIRTTVFTPQTAPETKKAAIRRHGVELRDEAPDYDSAERAAQQYAADQAALFISPYNHSDVIAGAGTAALEVLDVLPSFDVLVVPLGGGGLASGLGTVFKAAAPRARIIGVEAAASTPFAASLREGAITRINPGPSLADGLTGNLEAGTITFDMVRQLIDDIVSVDENEIADAVWRLAAEEHLIAEGAGAVATAAILTKRVAKPGESVVVMLTGSNIDAAKLAEILTAQGPQGTWADAHRKGG